MTSRKTYITEGEYYHFYNRGNSKQAIFLDDQDYDRFLKILFICNSRKNVNFKTDIIERKIDAWDFDRGDLLNSICAWVLMPNHFHLYIKAGKTLNVNNPNTISRVSNDSVLFMVKIGTAYAKYFNTKYSRTGSLFEGKFKSVQISNDLQARYLFSYIHLNPLKLIDSDWKERGVKNKTESLNYTTNYDYSSLKDWLGFNRKESSIIDKGALTQILPDKFCPEKDIFDWISFPEARLRESSGDLI